MYVEWIVFGCSLWSFEETGKYQSSPLINFGVLYRVVFLQFPVTLSKADAKEFKIFRRFVSTYAIRVQSGRCQDEGFNTSFSSCIEDTFIIIRPARLCSVLARAKRAWLCTSFRCFLVSPCVTGSSKSATVMTANEMKAWSKRILQNISLFRKQTDNEQICIPLNVGALEVFTVLRQLCHVLMKDKLRLASFPIENARQTDFDWKGTLQTVTSTCLSLVVGCMIDNLLGSPRPSVVTIKVR